MKNRMRSPGIDSQTYGQLIFDYDAKSTQLAEKIFVTNGAGTTGYTHREKNQNLKFISLLAQKRNQDGL